MKEGGFKGPQIEFFPYISIIDDFFEKNYEKKVF